MAIEILVPEVIFIIDTDEEEDAMDKITILLATIAHDWGVPMVVA